MQQVIAQIVEITQQLQNKAKNRQVSNAKRGLTHNMSAAATSSHCVGFGIMNKFEAELKDREFCYK